MTLKRGLALCATAMAVMTPAASAASVASHGGYVEVEANRGERNDIAVSWSENVLVVEDASAPLRAGPNCKQAGSGRVRCPGAPRALTVDLGDGADAFVARAPGGGPEIALNEIDGDAGDDTLVLPYGGRLEGDGGDDRLVVGSRFRRGGSLLGGNGRDVLKGGPGPESLEGGRGDDRVAGGGGRDRLAGGGGVYSNSEPGRDLLKGGAGGDRFDDGDAFGRVDRDTLIGGRGNDLVMSYAERQRPVVVNLSDRRGDGERGEDDLLRGVENVRGGMGNDRLVGNDAANKLEGWSGDDVILGRGADDRLILFDDERASGGGGDDRITGAGERTGVDCGGGDDTLAFVLTGVREEKPRAGLLAPPECEWIEGRHRLEYLTISAHPRVTGSGTFEFTIPHFKCCAHTLSLTLPDSPFEEIDSAPVDNAEVELDPSARRGTFRVSTLDAGDGNPLVWRFEVPGG